VLAVAAVVLSSSKPVTSSTTFIFTSPSCRVAAAVVELAAAGFVPSVGGELVRPSPAFSVAPLPAALVAPVTPEVAAAEAGKVEDVEDDDGEARVGAEGVEMRCWVGEEEGDVIGCGVVERPSDRRVDWALTAAAILVDDEVADGDAGDADVVAAAAALFAERPAPRDVRKASNGAGDVGTAVEGRLVVLAADIFFSAVSSTSSTASVRMMLVLLLRRWWSQIFVCTR
jgi:hypothetical protein